MKLTFHWAHHVWVNGETADWQVSPGLQKKVFSWLKQSYVTLELERPEVLSLHRGTVVLFYQERLDTFGRLCTEISAAFCAWYVPAACLYDVRKTLQQALKCSPNPLESTRVKIAWSTFFKNYNYVALIRKKLILRRPYILWGIGSIGIGGIILWVMLSNKASFVEECPRSQHRYNETVLLWNSMIDNANLQEFLEFWSPCRPQSVIDTLNRLIQIFFSPISRETWSDLDSATRYQEQGVFAAYGNFLTSVPFSEPPLYWPKLSPIPEKPPSIRPVFSLQHNDQQIHHTLLQITQQTHISQAFAMLAARHSPCLYLYLFRTASSHTDPPQQTCEQLKAIAKPYPTLYQWIVATQTHHP